MANSTADSDPANRFTKTVNGPTKAAQFAHRTTTPERAFHNSHSEKSQVVENDTGDIVGHLLPTHIKRSKEGSDSRLTCYTVRGVCGAATSFAYS